MACYFIFPKASQVILLIKEYLDMGMENALPLMGSARTVFC